MPPIFQGLVSTALRCSAEKCTRHSSVLQLRLVYFTVEQTFEVTGQGPINIHICAASMWGMYMQQMMKQPSY